ncbi:MAG: ribosome silencing factor [Deltaproteobacteria bacterium]|nr:ribosome silencing factor [Deltaproteobacteria bacterium]
MKIEIAKFAKQAALEKKATNIVLLDVAGKSDICEYHFVCSGDNNRQTIAIADAVEAKLRQGMKIVPFAIEGKNAGHWIAMDYGNTVIHVFHKDLRDFYAIEEIWPKARVKLPD